MGSAIPCFIFKMTRERKERMEKVRMLVLRTIEMGGAADFKYLEGYCMWHFGLSRRDAREEIVAIINLEGLECEKEIIRKKDEDKKATRS